MPPFRASSLIRVSSGSLDPHKQWYLLTKEICGMRPADFAKTELFTKIFPDEIQRIEWREVQPAKSYSTSNARQPSIVSVISSFGLCAGLLRQKVISPYGLIKSPAFEPVRRLVNTLTLDEEPQQISNSGGKASDNNVSLFKLVTELNAELAERKTLIEVLEKEMDVLKGKIFHLETEIGLSVTPSSSKPVSPMSCSSSSSPSTLNSSTSSVEETKNDPNLGSTIRKRKILKKCKEVMVSVNDVCQKYEESISSVLGNYFVFGGNAEKEEVRDVISNVVDLVMEAKGAKKGLAEIFSSQTYEQIFASLRVPDWVLLYFKLKTRLPDDAWQTLLNLTQLGKSGVSKNSLLHISCTWDGGSVLSESDGSIKAYKLRLCHT